MCVAPPTSDILATPPSLHATSSTQRELEQAPNPAKDKQFKDMLDLSKREFLSKKDLRPNVRRSRTLSASVLCSVSLTANAKLRHARLKDVGQ